MDTKKSDNIDHGYRYSVTEADQFTGITQQQVSKWRRRLQEPEKYRAMLYGAAYRKAFGDASRPGCSHMWEHCLPTPTPSIN